MKTAFKTEYWYKIFGQKLVLKITDKAFATQWYLHLQNIYKLITTALLGKRVLKFNTGNN